MIVQSRFECVVKTALWYNLEKRTQISLNNHGYLGVCTRQQSDRNKRRRIAFAIVGTHALGKGEGHQAQNKCLEKSSCRARASLANRDRLFVKSNGQSQSDDFSRLFSVHFFFSRHVISPSTFLSMLLFRFISYSLFQKYRAAG